MKLVFSQIGPFLVAALVMFAVYRRLRRNFGQQLLRPVRMKVRIATLLIIGSLLLFSTGHSLQFVAAALAGAAAGVLLAIWGAARTRYLWIEDQQYYVPHTYTGVAVTALFLGRLVYRLLQVYAATHTARIAGDPAAQQMFTPNAMVRSPLTLGLFFVLVGYYVCYYSLVLLRAKRNAAESVNALPT
jgi:hypothetical protein